MTATSTPLSTAGQRSTKTGLRLDRIENLSAAAPAQLFVTDVVIIPRHCRDRIRLEAVARFAERVFVPWKGRL